MTTDELRAALTAAATALTKTPPFVKATVLNPTLACHHQMIELQGPSVDARWKQCEVLVPDTETVLGILLEADPDEDTGDRPVFLFQPAFGGELPAEVWIRPPSVEYRRLLETLEDPVLGCAENWRRIAWMLCGEAHRTPRVPLGLPRYSSRSVPAPNAAQQRAIAMSLSDAPITLIEGPPGTGKTTVITEVIRSCVTGELRVACLSPTHLAVDNVIERLERDRHPFFPYRVGRGEKVAARHFNRENRFQTIASTLADDRLPSVAIRAKPPDIWFDPHLRHFVTAADLEALLALLAQAAGDLEVLAMALKRRWPERLGGLSTARLAILAANVMTLEQTWQANLSLAQCFGRLDEAGRRALTRELEDTGSAPLFGTTVGFLAAKELVAPSGDTLPFDVLIVDEASKLTLAQFLLGALRARKIVLVGDSCQLAPFRHERELEILKQHGVPLDLLDRSIFRHFELTGLPSHRIGLDVQYRMHPDVARFSNASFYGGRIQNGRTGGPNYLEHPTRVIWLDQKGAARRQGTSWINDSHIRAIQALLKDINWAAAARKRQISVGVMAFYGAQADQLQRQLKLEAHSHLMLEIGTVDSFQGKEGDVMILDLVRTAPEHWPLKFLNQAERVNVAFSRARDYTFIVGERETFRSAYYYISALFHHPEVTFERRFQSP